MPYYMLAGLGAQGVGGALNTYGASVSQDAMKKAYQDEMAKQAGFQKAAMGVMSGYTPQVGFSGSMQDYNAGVGDRLAAYRQANNIPLGLGTPGNPQLNSANADLMAQARAKMGGYQDMSFGQGLKLQQEGRDLAPITSAAAYDAKNVFPQLMYTAQNKGLPFQQAGTALGSIGGAAGLYGMYSKLFPGGNPGTTPQSGSSMQFQSAMTNGGRVPLSPALYGYGLY